MKKHILIILSLVFMTLSFRVKDDVIVLDRINNDDNAYISDSQHSDIETIFNITNSSKSILPELHNSLSLPSFRLLPSQKKTQQNPISCILSRHFSSEVQPTKNYNIKFSSPLSSNDDLIVIVRHLII